MQTKPVLRGRGQKHEALRRQLLAEINDGPFKPGDLFYSQNELASRFGVSQTTVLRALGALVDEGYLRREPGRGTFVTRPEAVGGAFDSLLIIGFEELAGSDDVAAPAIRGLLSRASGEGKRAQYACAFRSGCKVQLPDVSGFAAIAVWGGYHGVPWMLAQQTDAPIVVVRPTSLLVSGWFDTISRDYVGGARTVIGHLHERGYRRIALMGGPDLALGHHLRLEGALLAVNELGMTLNPEWVLSGEFRDDLAYERTCELLRREDRPEAIFSFSDPMAAGVIRAIHDLGLRIPEDVAVAGFDNRAFSSHLSPGLTCYETDGEDLARGTYELLETRLAGRDLPPRRWLAAGRVIVRQST